MQQDNGEDAGVRNIVKPSPMSHLHQSNQVCQFSTRRGAPLGSEKLPRYALLSKFEALG